MPETATDSFASPTVPSDEALRASESLKAAILNCSLDAIITMDHEGKVVDFNPAAERIFGFARAEVVGSPMAEKIVPERLREQHYQGLRHYLASGEGPVLGRRIEVPALHADGHEFFVELSINRISGLDPSANRGDRPQRRLRQAGRRGVHPGRFAAPRARRPRAAPAGVLELDQERDEIHPERRPGGNSHGQRRRRPRPRLRHGYRHRLRGAASHFPGLRAG